MEKALSGLCCLVTGAAGFLGKRIVLLLMEEDLAEIRVMDRSFSTDFLSMCEKFKKTASVKLLQGDIRDEEFLLSCCREVDLVIHAASVIDTLGQISKDVLMAINVTGTQNLLEACVHNNVPYFIYTSSVEVVGPNSRGDPVFDGNENMVYESKLNFPYGQSKMLAEQSVLKANGRVLKDGGTLITCSLRPMYIYGEGSQFLQLHLDQAILNNDVFHRQSRKEALVNPVYVGNVAWAHIQAARALTDSERAKKIAGNFYYISDDTPHLSYSDFNHTLGKELGLGVEPRLVLPFPLLYFVAFLMEILSFVLKPVVTFVLPFNRHLLILVNTPFIFSYKKAQRDMEYTPRYSWMECKNFTATWIASALPVRKEVLNKKKQN
ncbi:3 beta-hydroxysteroid dehydrogenase/Delta 5--_4-isomerase type 1-like [Bombina bombina]|uniref:3 beta-hydroxysteroid dehydrogenase/Delta 5-->4-isomerase type 1-like n=1 Tax=Bombina bombina TaxID=8345 RepID=UPI00235B1D00|nr:3 beta-hydroxysteroid dehydrogenase/Delta 5-->4-isomerase type 1-like [Bombina bombina]